MIRFYVILAVIVLSGAGFIAWRHSTREDAKNDLRHELQQIEIRKLDNVNKAKDRLRRTLRARPDSLHDDDGYRRD